MAAIGAVEAAMGGLGMIGGGGMALAGAPTVVVGAAGAGIATAGAAVGVMGARSMAGAVEALRTAMAKGKGEGGTPKDAQKAVQRDQGPRDVLRIDKTGAIGSGQSMACPSSRQSGWQKPSAQSGWYIARRGTHLLAKDVAMVEIVRMEHRLTNPGSSS